VNGRIVDIPSFVVKPGQQVAVKAKSKDTMSVQAALEARTRPALMDWLALDEKARVGRMVREPTRADIPLAAQEQLIVELYSK
jgi:small subunit ribosomal protein S4